MCMRIEFISKAKFLGTEKTLNALSAFGVGWRLMVWRKVKRGFTVISFKKAMNKICAKTQTLVTWSPKKIKEKCHKFAL